MSGLAAQQGFRYQDLFALHRVLELYQPGADLYVQTEYPERTAEAGEPWDVRISRTDVGTPLSAEYWQVKDTALDFPAQLRALRAIREAVPREALVGLVQSVPFIRKSQVAANFFETLRYCLPLARHREFVEQTVHLCYDTAASDAMQTITGIPDLDFHLLDYQPNVLSTGSVFQFARYDLRHVSPDGVPAQILFLIASRLGGASSHPAGSSVLDAFAAAAGQAIEYLRAQAGRPVPAREIVAPLRSPDGSEQTAAATRPGSGDVTRLLADNQAAIRERITPGTPSLQELFVPPSGRVTQPNQKSEESGEQDVEQWMLDGIRNRRWKFLLLLGDFGHGKTSLARHLVASLSAGGGAGDPIPVYLSLRRCAAYRDLREAVERTIAPFVQVTPELWYGREWVVFCDGFDELNLFYADRADWVRTQFLRLAQESSHPNLRVVVVSRPVLFLDPNQHAKLLEPYVRVRLAAFDEPQVRAWLDRWSRTHPPLSYQDLAGRGLTEIVRIPVVLFLIAQMYHARLHGDRGRMSKAAVYREFFSWVAETGGAASEEERGKHAPPPPGQLQDIAWQLFTHPAARSGTIHYRLLLRQLQLAEPDLRLDDRLFVSHAFRMAEPEHVEFIHQSLREYLVADRVWAALAAPEARGRGYRDLVLRAVVTPTLYTTAKFAFLRELCAAEEPARQKELVRRVVGLPVWPFLLDSLEEGRERFLVADRAEWDEDQLRVRQASTPVAPVAANVSVLLLLAKLYLVAATRHSYPALAGEFSAVRRALETDLRWAAHLQVLQRSVDHLYWEQMEFTDTSFDGCLLTGSEFSGCRFVRCSFRNTSWSGVHLTGSTKFFECVFADSEPAGEGVESAVFDRCEFRYASRGVEGEPPAAVRTGSARYTGCVVRHGDQAAFKGA